MNWFQHGQQREDQQAGDERGRPAKKNRLAASTAIVNVGARKNTARHTT